MHTQMLSETTTRIGAVMRRLQTRVATPILAATVLTAAGAGFLGNAGAASAETATPVSKGAAPVQASSIRSFYGAGGQVLRPDIVSAKVEAGATGQGVGQEACDAHADKINRDLDRASGYLAGGDIPMAQIYLVAAEAGADLAMDDGCFVVGMAL